MINKKGVALVIANSAYITQPKLKSCKKDGEDMRGALERLNFDVFFRLIFFTDPWPGISCNHSG